MPAMASTAAQPLRIVTGIGGWLLTVAITLVGLAALTFFIGRVIPIDPVLAIVGEKASQSVYDRVYLELGLDKRHSAEHEAFFQESRFMSRAG